MRTFDALRSRLNTIVRREPWWAEFASGWSVIAWAALSWIGTEPLDAWPSMRVVTLLAGDTFWTWTAGLLGAAQVLFLLLDVRWLRWGTSVLMCWFWGVMTAGVWAAVPWAPGVAAYAGWCAVNVLSILLLLRQHGH